MSHILNKSSHNLLVTIHAFVCKVQRDSDLLLALYDGDTLKAITENYVVKWGRQGLAQDFDQIDNHRVLFTDLSSHEFGSSKIYLVCQAVRLGAMEAKERDTNRSSLVRKSSTATVPQLSSNIIVIGSPNGGGSGEQNQMRRPFGVAAFDLTPKVRKAEDFKNTLDMPFIFCEKDSTLDSTLRKLVFSTDKTRIESKLAVSVDVLHGDLKQVSFE